MILQERIEELGSGILELKNNKVYLTGFLSRDRLEEYCNKNINCAFSHGIYDYENLDFSRIKDNALFLVIKNNKVEDKHIFNPIYKGSFKFKTEDSKTATRVFKIRIAEFSNKLNLIIDKKSLIFKNPLDLKDYLIKEYNYVLDDEVLNI